MGRAHQRRRRDVHGPGVRRARAPGRAQTRTGELRVLLALRDQARGLLAMEAANLEDTQDIDTARAQLATT